MIDEEKILSDIKYYIQQSNVLDVPIVTKKEKSYISNAIKEKETTLSNLLAYYLNENENHNFGRLFLNSLLNILYSKFKDTLDSTEYKYNFDIFYREIFNVTTEEFVLNSEFLEEHEGRIDILVETVNKRRDSAWSIIIENKLFHKLENDLENYWQHAHKKNKYTKIGVVLSINKVETNHPTFFNVLYKDYFSEIKKQLFEFTNKSNTNNINYLFDFLNYIDEIYQIRSEFDSTTSEYFLSNRKYIYMVYKEFVSVRNFIPKLKNIELLQLLLHHNSKFNQIEEFYLFVKDHFQRQVLLYQRLNGFKKYQEGDKIFIRGKSDSINEYLFRYVINTEKYCKGKSSNIEITLAFNNDFFKNLEIKIKFDSIIKAAINQNFKGLTESRISGWENFGKLELTLGDAESVKFFVGFLEDSFTKRKNEFENAVLNKINSKYRKLFFEKCELYFKNSEKELDKYENVEFPNELFFHYELSKFFAVFSLEWICPYSFNLSLWVNEAGEFSEEITVIKYATDNELDIYNSEIEKHADFDFDDRLHRFERIVKKNYNISKGEFGNLHKFFDEIRPTWMNFENVLIEITEKRNYEE